MHENKDLKRVVFCEKLRRSTPDYANPYSHSIVQTAYN